MFANVILMNDVLFGYRICAIAVSVATLSVIVRFIVPFVYISNASVMLFDVT